ncbi:MAG: GNAT family N-acetyltransferase [Actinomycetota bacterium]
MSIRRAVPDDAEQILRVVLRAIGGVAAGVYTAEQLEAWSAGFSDVSLVAAVDNTFALVAEVDGRVVGFANLILRDETVAELDLVYVDSAYQRSGVARALLTALETHAVSEGISELAADASLSAVALFEGAGYAVQSRYDKHYRGLVFANTWMLKKLR